MLSFNADRPYDSTSACLPGLSTRLRSDLSRRLLACRDRYLPFHPVKLAYSQHHACYVTGPSHARSATRRATRLRSLSVWSPCSLYERHTARLYTRICRSNFQTRQNALMTDHRQHIILLINSGLLYNSLNDGSFPRIHWSVQMARRVVSCILGLSIALATCSLATQIQKRRAALDHLRRSAARCKSWRHQLSIIRGRRRSSSLSDGVDNGELRWSINSPWQWSFTGKTSFTSLLLIRAVPVLNNSHLWCR